MGEQQPLNGPDTHSSVPADVSHQGNETEGDRRSQTKKRIQIVSILGLSIFVVLLTYELFSGRTETSKLANSIPLLRSNARSSSAVGSPEDRESLVGLKNDLVGFPSTELCDNPCNEHGQCKNGTCSCDLGWNGKHCTIEGCPSNCSNHGECREKNGQWKCHCSGYWKGKNCGIPYEGICNDGKDNDNDGSVDCEDPDCCGSHWCIDSESCKSVPNPVEVLVRLPEPPENASFFDRMKFLITSNSTSYMDLEFFNKSCVAVIRGQFVTSAGMIMKGGRVATKNKQEGITFTHDGGMFDLMVNGGVDVNLTFFRQSFSQQHRTFLVSCNEIVIIDKVTMLTENEKAVIPAAYTCSSDDDHLMGSVVLAEQRFQKSNKTFTSVYNSSRTPDYLWAIEVQLTPENIPPTLRYIYLEINIAGNHFEESFEADPGIKAAYTWNGLNVYRQWVDGVTTAVVKVVHIYTDCIDTYHSNFKVQFPKIRYFKLYTYSGLTIVGSVIFVGTLIL